MIDDSLLKSITEVQVPIAIGSDATEVIRIAMMGSKKY